MGRQKVLSAADLMLAQRERPFSLVPCLEWSRVVGLAGHRRCAGGDTDSVVVALFVVVRRLPHFSWIPMGRAAAGDGVSGHFSSAVGNSPALSTERSAGAHRRLATVVAVVPVD